MKERPILFSAPMVLAILSGQKTVTRRVVKVQPFDLSWSRRDHRFEYVTGRAENGDEVDGFHAYTTRSGGEWSAKCPYGQPGDRLWVRESWRVGKPHDKTKPVDILPSVVAKGQGVTVLYDAGGWKSFGPAGRDEPVYPDDAAMPDWAGKGRSSIHMPRDFCRILLEITAVRVERLQDISEEQAEAEGCFFTDYGRKCFHGGRGVRDASECEYPDSKHQQREGWMWDKTASHEQCLGSARFAFANLWQKTGGDWNANPWVWVIEFKRIEVANADQ